MSESTGNTPSEWPRLAPPPRPLTGKDQWNVFLSYGSVNRPWALNLYDVLRQHGHRVFIDQCVLKPGNQLIKRLPEALQASQSGVLIWSSASVDSDWVRSERLVLERLSTDKPGFQFVLLRLDSATLPLRSESSVVFDFNDYPDGPNGGELLRLLHALVGQPMTREAAGFAREQDEAAKAAAARIASAIRNGYPDRLIQLFEEGGLMWETSSVLGCKAAEGLIRLNRNTDAIAMLEQIEQRFPRAVRPKQLHTLALARRGQGDDLIQAQAILGELYASGERDPETLGIYGRTWMDRYARSGDIGDLQQSRDLYAEAFERAPDDYYTGINAAAKSVFLGTDYDLAKAADYAQRVQNITGSDPARGDYWMTATIGEVFLIQKKYQDAARLYTEAVGMAPQEIASQMSTWKQASRLMEKLRPTDTERALVRQAFAHLPGA